MATVDVLLEGYVREADEYELVQPTITLVRDGTINMVVDPGLLADVEQLRSALLAHGVSVDQITHVFLTHQHVDHTRNVGLFRKAKVYDYESIYDGDIWAEHEGDGHQISPDIRIMHTPGHTAECASLVVDTDEGTVVLSHVWWFSDMTPVQDPMAEDQDALDSSRERVLSEADIVIPGHGAAFRVHKRP